MTEFLMTLDFRTVLFCLGAVCVGMGVGWIVLVHTVLK